MRSFTLNLYNTLKQKMLQEAFIVEDGKEIIKDPVEIDKAIKEAFEMIKKGLICEEDIDRIQNFFRITLLGRDLYLPVEIGMLFLKFKRGDKK